MTPAAPASGGKVYLLGAGPGNVDHLTVRGQQVLRQADSLIYDALVDPRLLAQLSAACDTIQVGKRGGQPSTPQSEISQLLVDQCQQGKQVVRLKSGDPFIFGRAAVEIQALKAANCDFEVIPGVSSALAAPLLSAIPLTDPALSHGFGVFTAHNLQTLDWATLANLETLVLLMGGRYLGDICHQLQIHGLRGETPVAIIHWASQPQQRLWQGTLLSIAQLTKGERLSPCIIVIGEVIRLREFLSPTVPSSSANIAKALTRKIILATRAAGQSSSFTTLLSRQGATVIELPALEIRPPSSWAALDQALEHLSGYDWLVLTSANAVTFFLDRLLAQGLKADFIPTSYVADALVEEFPVPLPGLRLLFPRVETGGRDVLVKEFTAQTATVTEVAAYESGCPQAMASGAAAALQQGQVNAVTFASSKTVRHFIQLMAAQFGEGWRGLLDGVAIASIGPQTTQACYDCLGRVDIEATTYTLEGLTEALVQWANHG